MAHGVDRFRFALAGALAALMLAAGAGCTPPEEEGIHPVWPLPPAPPRVQHLKNIRGEKDLAKPNFFDQLGTLITGRAMATLLRPHGVAVVEDEMLYVTDQERQAVAAMDLKSGKTKWIVKAGKTFLVSPVGVAVVNELLAVSDSALKEVYLFRADGKLEGALVKPGSFRRPTGLAFDAKRQLLYVVDTLANEVCVFSTPRFELIRRVGEQGIAPGQFNYPTHIFIDAGGRVYVTDSLNFRVQVFSPEGAYLFDIGKLGDASGHMAVPKGVGVDSYGHIYIVDSYFSTVQVFDQKGRFLLSIGGPGELTGQFQVPSGLAVDSKDRIYVCDTYNRRIQLLQYVGGPTNVQLPTTNPTRNPATSPANR